MAIDNIGKKTNKTEIGRRTTLDPKWQKCKEIVRKRDKGRCQFQYCISIVEAHKLIVGTQKELDPAHILAASDRPELIYNPDNVITLQRYIHRRMDNYENPLTGESISLNEHYYWWWRIKNHKVAEYDENVNYKDLL